MPIIFLVSFVFTGAIQLSELDERFIGVVFVAGIALAALMVNPTSFISNLISLDQENFLFVRSLPLSMKRYLREKFRFGVVLQLSLTAVIVLAAVLLFKMPLILAVSFLIGALWSSFLCAWNILLVIIDCCFWIGPISVNYLREGRESWVSHWNDRNAVSFHHCYHPLWLCCNFGWFLVIEWSDFLRDPLDQRPLDSPLSIQILASFFLRETTLCFFIKRRVNWLFIQKIQKNYLQSKGNMVR